MRPPTRVGAAATVAAVLLASAGCSDDGGSTKGAGTSASPTATTTADTAERSVTTLIQTGITQAQQGDLDAAATTFGNALVLDPDNKYALYNLGLIAQTNKQAAAARKYYDAALKADPSYTPAMYNKAILLESTDLAGAAKLYERIVAINPKASTAYLRLGFADADLGKADAATAARAKALQLDPSLADVTAPDRG